MFYIIRPAARPSRLG